ncbi:uncharacterized protein LOC143285103 [Babylonia areolata]|uniref:uncharacterized protein LOC143285103 n=1 Tax=Babylonia areolata TaxID=304850 RepID=UPI003FD1FEA2
MSTMLLLLRPILFVVVIAVSVQVHPVHSIDLESTPETFVPGVTPNLTLKCTPGDTMGVIANILVFQLSKDGALLATGKPDGFILSESLRKSKYSGSNQIDVNNLANSFLLFNIQFPEAEDEGEYMCHMNYEDKDGFFQNAEVTFDLVQNATNDDNLQSQLKQVNQLVENLRARIGTLETQVFELASVNSNQSRVIADLASVSSNRIAFFATLEKQTVIGTDDVIVFDHVLFNNGSAFNATTGAFLAPRTGFYMLSLVCEVQTTVPLRMELLLTVNGATAMKLFVAGEMASHGGQQSGSLVYWLSAGSEVKVVVGNIQTQPAEAAPVSLLSENLSYFSGYLLG